MPGRVFAIATARQARCARDQTKIQREQVEAAREQTRLQRAIADETVQPHVWADIQPDMKQGTVLDLIIGNSGPSVAMDVKAAFDAPLPRPTTILEDPGHLLQALADGLRSLAPGRAVRWYPDTGSDLLGEDAPNGSLHLVQKPIQNLISSSTRRPVALPNGLDDLPSIAFRPSAPPRSAIHAVRRLSAAGSTAVNSHHRSPMQQTALTRNST